MSRLTNGRRALKTAANVLTTDASATAEILRPDFGLRAKLTPGERRLYANVPDALLEHVLKSRSAHAPRSPGAHPFASDISPEDRSFLVTENTKGVDQQRGWNDRILSAQKIRQRYYSNHQERADKNGLAFLPGKVLGGKRKQLAVTCLGQFIYDLDKLTPQMATELIEQLETSGLAVEVYSTYSHMSTESAVKSDKIVTDADAREYFKGKGYPESIVASARLIEAGRETPDGLMTIIGHDPIAKLRVVFWSDEDFRAKDQKERLGITEKAARTDALGFIFDKLGRPFDFPYDESCTTIERAFYAASCKPKQSAVALVKSFPGKCVRLAALQAADGSELDAFIAARKGTGARPTGRKGDRAASDYDVTVEGFTFNLVTWAAQGGNGFELDAALNVDEAAPRKEGRHVECPFEQDHTEPGGSGTFVVDATDNDGSFRVHCCHNSCLTARGNGGNGVDRLLFVRAWIESGALTLETLRDPEFYADGKVPDCLREKPTKESIETACNALNVESDSDDADAIIADLATLPPSAFDDKIKKTLVGLKLVSAKTFDAALKAARASKSKKTSDDADNASWSHEYRATMDRYVEDFVIVNTGGNGAVYDTKQTDMSKAIMSTGGFITLHAIDWIDTGGDVIYPAAVFVGKPPKNTRVYKDGFVFKPSGGVKPSELNLYKGMCVEPDGSGDCSLLHELLSDVWARGDADTKAWVTEYLMHIIKYPGEKVRTSLAIRGEPGDGKSFVFEKLMITILGDMQLRVANHRMILGDFNEAMIGKLVTVLEEAAFAGDKAAFDKMKELVTGEKVLINPKFKAPITVDNFSRLIVVSNHDHFLHIKPNDRRYTVLESCSAWANTDKFDKLKDQWENGGAAKFMHDALKHSFRRFDDNRQLVINTTLKTMAAARQTALSRSALEKCIVSFLLRGDFSSPQSGDAILINADGDEAYSAPQVWQWDKPLVINSQALEQSIGLWLRDFDPSAARHEATLHTIVKVLEEHIGETSEKRPKGAKNADGKRAQLPTQRTLPSRGDALRTAWERRRITDEEFCAAGGERLPTKAQAPVEAKVSALRLSGYRVRGR